MWSSRVGPGGCFAYCVLVVRLESHVQGNVASGVVRGRDGRCRISSHRSRHLQPLLRLRSDQIRSDVGILTSPVCFASKLFGSSARSSCVQKQPPRPPG